MILLERRTAAAGVADDGVEAAVEDSVDIVAGEFAGVFLAAGVDVERAAAALGTGNVNFAAVFLEDANGGFVEARERDVLNATGEEGDLVFAGSFGGKRLADLAKEEGHFGVGGERFDFGEFTEWFQNAAGADELLQAGGLVEK